MRGGGWVDSPNLGCNGYGRLLRTSGYDRMAFIPDLTICGYCTAQYIRHYTSLCYYHYTIYIYHYTITITTSLYCNLSHRSIDAGGPHQRVPGTYFVVYARDTQTSRRASEHNMDRPLIRHPMRWGGGGSYRRPTPSVLCTNTQSVSCTIHTKNLIFKSVRV